MLAADREAADREEAVRVAAEKRKRKIDEVSDVVPSNKKGTGRCSNMITFHADVTIHTKYKNS